MDTVSDEEPIAYEQPVVEQEPEVKLDLRLIGVPAVRLRERSSVFKVRVASSLNFCICNVYLKVLFRDRCLAFSPADVDREFNFVTGKQSNYSPEQLAPRQSHVAAV